MFRRGENTIRLATTGFFPHLVGLRVAPAAGGGPTGATGKGAAPPPRVAGAAGVDAITWDADCRIDACSDNLCPKCAAFNGHTIVRGHRGWVVYAFDSPAAFVADVAVRYNAVDRRVLRLSFNLQAVGEVADGVSGSWSDPGRSVVSTVGPVRVVEGRNVVRLDAPPGACFPHLAAITIAPRAGAAAATTAAAAHDQWPAHCRITAHSHNLLPRSEQWKFHTIHNGENGWVEYNHTARGTGMAHLHVQYNAEGARPLELLVNGVSHGPVAGNTTGSWTDVRKARWDVHGPVPLTKGANTLRLQTQGYFPHLLAFRLVPCAAGAGGGAGAGGAAVGCGGDIGFDGKA